jgi:hypothetical protein
MPSNSPAQIRDRAAPFSRVFTTAQADLTAFTVNSGGASGTAISIPYGNPSSGMTLIALTAAAVVLTWKDCAGVVNTISYTATLAGQSIPIPSGAISLDVVTNCAVHVYWHGSSSPQRVSVNP